MKCLFFTRTPEFRNNVFCTDGSKPNKEIASGVYENKARLKIVATLDATWWPFQAEVQVLNITK